MDAKKKNLITKRVQIVLSVLAVLVFFYGCVSAKQAGEERKVRRAAEKIELTVTEKFNESVSFSSLEYDLLCTLKNDSKVKIDAVSGTFKIMDLEGNVLNQGEAELWGEIEGKSEKEFKLTWRTDITEKGQKIYESDISSLTFSYEITEITYDGYEVVEIKK